MSQFSPWANTRLDIALDIISPHSPQKLGTIEISEVDKIIDYIRKMWKHRTILLLHRFGSDELIEELWRTEALLGWHRLKFTTRVDQIFSDLTQEQVK